ncbi:MAG: GNAT family N-acetyltransferase [Candidatus Woesearchaeota archaeon]
MIRRFQEEDLDMLQQVIHASNSSLIGVYTQQQTNALNEVFSKEFLLDRSKKYEIYVYVIDGVIVGTASLAVSKEKIKGMFVHPAHQKQGIGRSLLNRVEQAAKEHGITYLQADSSLAAVMFYEKHGYTRKEIIMNAKFGNSVRVFKQL